MQGANSAILTMLAETLEDAVIRFHRIDSPQPQAPLNDLISKGLTTWGVTAQVLKKLSLDPEAGGSEEDCWKVLGLSVLHGPAPSTGDIHARLKLADMLVKVAEQPDWTPADRKQAIEFLQKAEKAAAFCQAKLTEVLRHRKMLKVSPAIPRWMEPDPDFLIHLAAEARKDGGNTLIVTQLSNLHGLDLAPLAPIVKTPNECRPIYQALYGSPSEIHRCISNFQGKSVILWAPDNGRSLGQVLGVLDKMHKEGNIKFDLHFLVPFVPMPGCPSPEMIGELWSHQMLAPKFSHLRKSVAYYMQPMRCAFSGQSAPLHHLKNIAIITLASHGAPKAHALRQFKQEIIQHDIGRAIRVDVPEDQQRGVLIYLRRLQMVHCLGWESGPKSPGSTSAAKRALLIGYFDEGHISSLDLVGIVRQLRNLPELRFAFIGPESLFANPHALIMDLAEIRSVYAAGDMINEMVLVSPSRAIIDTSHSIGEWENVLTDQFQQDPKSAIKGIRFRQGIFKGRPFAKPGVLSKVAFNERARQRLAHVPAEIRERELLTMSLHIDGLPVTQRLAIVQKIISQIDVVAGVRLGLRTGESLAPGEWCLGEESEEGGNIAVLLRNPEEHVKLLSHIHGAGLSINGHFLSLEVCSIQPRQFAGYECRSFASSVSAPNGAPSSSSVSANLGSHS